jgi:hypothetical protein
VRALQKQLEEAKADIRAKGRFQQRRGTQINQRGR